MNSEIKVHFKLLRHLSIDSTQDFSYSNSYPTASKPPGRPGHPVLRHPPSRSPVQLSHELRFWRERGYPVGISPHAQQPLDVGAAEDRHVLVVWEVGYAG